MNKNPFSIYDFLGYLFPGLVALMAVTYVAFSSEQSVNKLFSITNFKDVFTNEVSISEWQSTVVIIILSYIAGHIVAYLSSVVVEKFSNRLFKYPSLYLIHTPGKEWLYPSHSLPGVWMTYLVYYIDILDYVIIGG